MEDRTPGNVEGNTDRKKDQKKKTNNYSLFLNNYSVFIQIASNEFETISENVSIIVSIIVSLMKQSCRLTSYDHIITDTARRGD